MTAGRPGPLAGAKAASGSAPVTPTSTRSQQHPADARPAERPIDIDAAIRERDDRAARIERALRLLLADMPGVSPEMEHEVPRVALKYAAIGDLPGGATGAARAGELARGAGPTEQATRRLIEQTGRAAEAWLAVVPAKRARPEMRLRKAMAKLTPEAWRAVPEAIRVAAGLRRGDVAEADVSRLAAGAREAVEIVPPPSRSAGPGRLPDYRLVSVALMLAQDFEMLTGAPAVERNWNEDEDGGGPFVLLLEEVLKVNGIEKGARRLARHVAAARRGASAR